MKLTGDASRADQPETMSCLISNEKGITLLWIAIGLICLGLILIPAIQIYNISIKAERKARNQVSTELASSALNKYFLMFGHYPAPATPSVALGAADFGQSAVKPGTGWPDCQNGATPDGAVCSTVLNTDGGKSVLVGVVPFAELNIPFSSVLDANKNLLTYAVTEDQTDNTTYAESGGAIIVLRSDNSPTYATGAKSHFVVVGHGEDGAGAFGQNGVRNIACRTNADSDDFENCNRDGTFRSNQIPGTSTVEMNFGATTAYFDDYLIQRNSTVSGIWSYVPDPLATDLSIRDRVGGNVATGNCDGQVPCIPVARLDIYGDGSANIPAVRADEVKTARICARGNPGGDFAPSGYFGCVNDYTLAKNTAGVDQSVCAGGYCPGATASWTNANLPPWLTPQLIVGTPPVLPEGGLYWVPAAGNHGDFHFGNGIMCVGQRALNGIFDNDEACNNTSWVSPPTKAALSACPTGEYARGLTATGAFYCQKPADNM